MPDIIGTMFFTSRVGSRVAGWSESHYIIGATSLPNALPTLRNLANARVQILGANVSLPYLRVSATDVYRDSQVYDGPSPRVIVPALPRSRPIGFAVSGADAVAPPPYVSTGDYIHNTDLVAEAGAVSTRAEARCDLPKSCLLIRCECGSTFTSRRPLFLRGVPDYVINTGADRPDAGAWSDALKEYLRLLLSGPYGMRANNMGPTNPPFPVQSINTTTTTPTFTVAAVPAGAAGAAAPAMPAVGDKVRLSGTRLINALGGAVSFDGNYTVIAVQPGPPAVYTFAGLQSLLTNLVTAKKGAVRLRSPTVQVYTQFVIRRWSERAVGRPFDPFRGRRKARF